MQTENLECKIAQAQMGRYLGGEGLSSEAIANLEFHVKACKGCKEAIQERRKALESVLALPITEEFPALQVDRPQIKPAGMPWVDAIRRVPAAAEAVGEPRKKNWRTPVYAGGLMVVLVAMTSLTNEPTRVFGDRAMTTGPKIVKSEAPAEVASNALLPLSTQGTSPITITEGPPRFKLADFVPGFMMSAADRHDLANTDMALTRQIMEIEVQKKAVEPAKITRKRRSSNVVRVYAPEPKK